MANDKTTNTGAPVVRLALARGGSHGYVDRDSGSYAMPSSTLEQEKEYNLEQYSSQSAKPPRPGRGDRENSSSSEVEHSISPLRRLRTGPIMSASLEDVMVASHITFSIY